MTTFLTRRLFLGGAAAVAATVVAPLIVPSSALILPTKPEIVTDWLPCDGRSLDKARYPELYRGIAHIERTYGPRVPLMRGVGTWTPVLDERVVCPYGENELTFNLPGEGAPGTLDGLQPSMQAEFSKIDFYISTRDITLPSGLILRAATMMPNGWEPRWVPGDVVMNGRSARFVDTGKTWNDELSNVIGSSKWMERAA